MCFPNRDKIYWHSNVIAERINQTELKSITGSIYVLKGPMDYVTMKNQGIQEWPYMFYWNIII